MWMFTVEAEYGRRIQAYKHIFTRRYVHLDGTGAAFVYREDGRYQQVDALWLIDMVLERSLSVPWSEEEEERKAERSVSKKCRQGFGHGASRYACGDAPGYRIG